MIKRLAYLFLCSIAVSVFILPDSWILQNVAQYETEFHLSDKLIYAKLYLVILMILLGLALRYSILEELISVLKFPINKIILIPLGLLFFLLLVMANWFPVMLDEANSYLFFVKRGFLVTTAYYPAPNNHVFSNLLAGVVNLFGFKSAFSLRFVSICSVVTAGYFLQLLLKEFFSSRVAILATFMWLGFYHTLVYGFLGRGYSLEVLLFTLSLLSLVKWIKNNRRGYLYWYVLFSMLGFYTVPTYLFYFLPASLFWIWETRKVKLWFLSTTAVGLGSVLLYYPIILFSGLESLLGNHWVSASDSFYGTFFSQFQGFFEFQWLFSNGLFFSLILIAVYYKMGKNVTPMLKVIGLSYGVLVLVSGLIQHFPPFRSLHLFTLLNFVLIASLLESALDKNKIILFVLPIMIAGWSIYTLYDFRLYGMSQYDDLVEVDKLLEAKKVDKVTVDEDFYYVMLKYHWKSSLEVNFDKECDFGYFLSVENEKESIGETKFTSLQYCSE